jgi:hypothetical protein
MKAQCQVYVDVMFGYSNCNPSALIFCKASDTVDGSSSPSLEDQKRRHNLSSCLKLTEEEGQIHSKTRFSSNFSKFFGNKYKALIASCDLPEKRSSGR